MKIVSSIFASPRAAGRGKTGLSSRGFSVFVDGFEAAGESLYAEVFITYREDLTAELLLRQQN